MNTLPRTTLDLPAAHDCGGTILTGGHGDLRHAHCDRCAAYRYDDAAVPFPRGTDETVNRAAWDDGRLSSPE